MSIEMYKVVHVCGILLLFSGLIGLWGVTVAGGPVRGGLRAGLSAVHGVGLILILLSGFAMAGTLGFLSHIPGWIYAKIVIWLLLGGTLGLAKRRAELGAALITGWVVLGTAAAYLALLKPF